MNRFISSPRSHGHPDDPRKSSTSSIGTSSGRLPRKAVAALRNRWRRQQVAEPLRHEIAKEHSHDRPDRRQQDRDRTSTRATGECPLRESRGDQFTEVGYVGRDVDTIIRDLAEVAIKQTREQATRAVRDRTRRRRTYLMPCCRRAQSIS